ncbi:hypothetical protein HY500_00845 [Candidatus Woesearchaeota archaeon]|nr:hypothetical protein [Candidatus Woesearchaeota archaeon]
MYVKKIVSFNELGFLTNIVHSSRDAIIDQLERRGYNFLGVTIGKCPDKYRSIVLMLIKQALSSINLDGRSMYVHEEHLGEAFSSDIESRLRLYREMRPYVILLIDDPERKLTLTGCSSHYTMDLEACLEYERARLNPLKEEFNPFRNSLPKPS